VWVRGDIVVEFAAHCVIYRIYEEKQLVVVCAVGPRKQGDAADVYEQFQALAQTGKVAQQIEPPKR
jgi:hypothetical protein